MFRPMQRVNRQLPEETCIELLKTQLRGVLSVIGDDGYPYGMPMDHWYCEQDGKIYFHSGKAGHKIDAMRKNGKACYCLYDEGVRLNGDWALTINSVIVFGHIEFVEDREKAIQISRALSYKFISDSDYIEDQIAHHADRVLCFALVPEHMTGKRVLES